MAPAAPFIFDYVFQPGGHQHERGPAVGGGTDDAGSAADLPVEAFDGVVRPGPGDRVGSVGVSEVD